MGNSSTKEVRGSSSRTDSLHPSGSPSRADNSNNNAESRHNRYGSGHVSRSSRSNRHDLSLFGIGGASDSVGETRKETKQEREARKAEKERIVRAIERERSLKEEGIDGGYLVTLGTYTGVEDFSKPVVRQLMIERRLAPFWRGLNDHSESWTQHQLVAVARGLPIPAPDDIPLEDSTSSPAPSQSMVVDRSATSSQPRVLSSPSQSQTHLSSSHPALSRLGGGSSTPPSAPSSLFRGRSKTLASITSMRNLPPTEVQPQEIQLPQDPFVNGQPIEAVLYKDAAECPICFLYYPPYLNRTRCCDQPICSECFVQIKRPDPHPPEHADPSAPPSEPKPLEDADQLVSEAATCPFCVQSEFGVSYDPPSYRRGLAYLIPQNRNQPFIKDSPAMSSSSSLSPPSEGTSLASAAATRKRAVSLSANAPTVITTDRVRPDWAKKLSDARMNAARKAAAATALHTAAFMMGGTPGAGPSTGRRRRGLLGLDSPSGLSRSGSAANIPGGVGIPNVDVLLAALEASGANSLRGNGELATGRGSSRQNRAQDLEDIMLMEAIRLSLAAEEERRKKEDKEAAKDAKKDDKKKVKDQKKADKAAKKSGFHSPSASQEGVFASDPERSPMSAVTGTDVGKGKAKMFDTGHSSRDATKEAGPTRSTESLTYSGEPQRYLKESRAVLDSSLLGGSPVRSTSDLHGQSHLRQFSTASSTDSSFLDSPAGSFKPGFDTSAFGPSPSGSGSHFPYAPQSEGASNNGTPGTESMFNFGSLAAMMGKNRVGSIDVGGTQHIEHPIAEEEDEKAAAGVERHLERPPIYEDTTASRLYAEPPPTSDSERGSDLPILSGNYSEQRNFSSDVNVLRQEAHRQSSQ